MVKKEDIQKLADLSRITISPEEINALSKDIDAILSYVSDINRVANDEITENTFDLHNVLREDGNPHESGIFSKELLNEAPKRDGDYIKVKRVLLK